MLLAILAAYAGPATSDVWATRDSIPVPPAVVIGAAADGTLLAASPGSLMESFDGALSWRIVQSLPSGTPTALGAADGALWYVADGTNLYRSDDAGRNWEPAEGLLVRWGAGLRRVAPDALPPGTRHVLPYAGGSLAAAPDGVWVRPTETAPWQRRVAWLSDPDVRDAVVDTDGSVLALTASGVFRAGPDMQWKQVATGPSFRRSAWQSPTGGLWALDGGDWFVRSDDHGVTWRRVGDRPCRAAADLPNGAIGCTEGYGVSVVTLREGELVATRSQRGFRPRTIDGLASDPAGRLLVAIGPGGVLRSEDDGRWEVEEGQDNVLTRAVATAPGTGWPSLVARKDSLQARQDASAGYTRRAEGNFTAVTFDGRGNGVALAGTAQGKVLRSEDAGWSFADWSTGLPGATVKDLVIDTGGVAWAALWGEGLWRRAGEAWARVTPEDVGFNAVRVAVDPRDRARLWVAAFDRGLWTSADAGATWATVGTDLCRLAWDVTVSALDGRVYAGCEDGRVLAGTSSSGWSPLPNLGLKGDVHALAWLASDPATLVVATSEGEAVRWSAGAVVSTNNPLAHASVLAGAVATDGDRAVFQTIDGLKRTSDRGLHWTSAGMGGKHLDALALDRDGLTMAVWVHGEGVSWSGDGGRTWTRRGAPAATAAEARLVPDLETTRLSAVASPARVAIRPDAPDITLLLRDGSLFVATPELEPRVSGLVSRDRGTTWTVAGKGDDPQVERDWGPLLRIERKVRLTAGEHGLVRWLARDAAGGFVFAAGEVIGTVDDQGRATLVGTLPEGVQTVFADPASPRVLYAGTKDGVRVSTDLGHTWEPYVR